MLGGFLSFSFCLCILLLLFNIYCLCWAFHMDWTQASIHQASNTNSIKCCIPDFFNPNLSCIFSLQHYRKTNDKQVMYIMIRHHTSKTMHHKIIPHSKFIQIFIHRPDPPRAKRTETEMCLVYFKSNWQALKT